MKGGNFTGGFGILIVALAAVLFFGAKGLFPGLTKALSVILLIAVVAIAVIVVLVIYFAFRKPSEGKTVTKGQQVSAGRRRLIELQDMNRKIKNEEIRKLNGEISEIIEKILGVLKTQKSETTNLYQFFNYYLPTLGSILNKYVSLEQNGSANEEVVKNTVSGLTDIKHAMVKQYEGLLEDRVLDMSVEMEALTLACKRDGLLSEEESGGQE